jgi:hypothetical protein
MNSKVESIINTLNEIEVDGEHMQYILEKVGMEGQMLKQLIMTADSLSLTNCLEEREEIEQKGFLKDFWQDVYNREGELKNVAKKVWDDFCNNNTLWANTFEDYWKHFKVKQ